MPYQPLTYPVDITQAYWDRKKGIAAKLAGKTGISEAATKAERAFGAIDWTKFDIEKRAPMGISEEKLKAVRALKDDVIAEWHRSLKPAIDHLKELKVTATTAAGDMKKNKLLKDATKIAEDMATGADHFSVALQLNSLFFERVNKTWETNVKAVQDGLKTLHEAMARTGDYLRQLLAGLAHIQKTDVVTMALWDEQVKQQGRSVSNNLKGNPELAKKYLKTWTTEFQGFDWVTLGFHQIEPGELKKELGHFIGEVVKEAQLLRTDL